MENLVCLLFCLLIVLVFCAPRFVPKKVSDFLIISLSTCIIIWLALYFVNSGVGKVRFTSIFHKINENHGRKTYEVCHMR